MKKSYFCKLLKDEEPPSEVWCLSHFLAYVVRMSKTTTKVRIAFDCTAKCDGVF